MCFLLNVVSHLTLKSAEMDIIQYKVIWKVALGKCKTSRPSCALLNMTVFDSYPRLSWFCWLPCWSKHCFSQIPPAPLPRNAIIRVIKSRAAMFSPKDKQRLRGFRKVCKSYVWKKMCFCHVKVCMRVCACVCTLRYTNYHVLRSAVAPEACRENSSVVSQPQLSCLSLSLSFCLCLAHTHKHTNAHGELSHPTHATQARHVEAP